MAVSISYRDIVKLLRREKVPAFLPSEREYEISVATANLVYRFTRPGCVVLPETISDVEFVVITAATRNIELTIKSGGHSYAGFSTTDEGILMDLKRMKEVSLAYDDQAQPDTVTIQIGAVWGDVYRTLINGRHNGYIINGGRCPSVGVGGFILGGGLGPFTRTFGMGCDTLIAATIVTADGIRREISDSSDKQEDRSLFWALRGAGGGNFGVVVDVTMKVMKLKTPAIPFLDGIVAGVYVWYPKSTTCDRFHQTMEAIYTHPWPPELTMDVTWLRECKPGAKPGDSKLGIRLTTYFDGHTATFHDLIDAAIPENDLTVDLRRELKRRALFERSTRFLHESLALMWEEEARDFLPRTSENRYQLYSSYVYDDAAFSGERRREIAGAVRALQEEFARRFEADGDECNFRTTFIHAGGKAGEPAGDATAFPWRGARYHAYLNVVWKDKWLEDKVREFFREATERLRAFSVERRAAYVNFGDVTLAGQEGRYEGAYFGANLEELRRIKGFWDPGNVFRGDQTIRPPANPRPLPPGKIGRGDASPKGVLEGEEDGARDADYILLSRRASVPSGDSSAGKSRSCVPNTDVIATKGWESFPIPPPSNYVDIH